MAGGFDGATRSPRQRCPWRGSPRGRADRRESPAAGKTPGEKVAKTARTVRIRRYGPPTVADARVGRAVTGRGRRRRDRRGRRPRGGLLAAVDQTLARR